MSETEEKTAIKGPKRKRKRAEIMETMDRLVTDLTPAQVFIAQPGFPG